MDQGEGHSVKSSLTPQQLADYVKRQLDMFFPISSGERGGLTKIVSASLRRTAACFQAIDLKYFREGRDTLFDHRNTDHYAMFLAIAAREAFLDRHSTLASETYALNKALHGIDVFFEVELPSVFLFVHPVGTVLGRADYGEFFCVYQGCTVGTNVDGGRPRLGEGVVMFPGSRLLGACELGPNSWVGAGAHVIDQTMPGNSLVVGSYPTVRAVPTDRSVRRDVFGLER
jgi:serine O-acetyltransferase